VKVTTTQYAKTLHESIKDKSQKEISGIISEFIKILAKNNQIKNSEKIINKFNDIHNQENKIVEAEVTSQDKLSADLFNKISNFVKHKYQAKEVSLNNIIDKKIKGGIVIKVGDELMNASISKQLEKLRSSLEK
jgi:F-type H+-transporting ATPase subunit delta